MLRILELGAEDSAKILRDPSLCAVPPEDVLRWVDLTSPTSEELDAVGQAFKFHSLALDDCKTFDQRPKLEPYGDHLFVVMHRLACSRQTFEVQGLEVHAFLGGRYLVTVHDQPLRELDHVFERLQNEPQVMKRGPAFWYYLLADRIVGSTLGELEILAQAVEDNEEHVLQGKQDKMVESIFALKRNLAVARRLVSPQRELFASLSNRGSTLIDERTSLYFRSVHDELVRAVESIESHRELLSNALDAHFSAVSQRMNEIMKHLTLLSSIFLPLTFVSGFFGMNFEHLPFGSDALMWGCIAACFVVPGAMMLWFKTRRWI